MKILHVHSSSGIPKRETLRGILKREPLKETSKKMGKNYFYRKKLKEKFLNVPQKNRHFTEGSVIGRTTIETKGIIQVMLKWQKLLTLSPKA